jgi:hypothetical protein
VKLSPINLKVLEALHDETGDYCYRSFASISRDTGLDRKAVRRACRFLARKGLAVYGRGLWTDEGEPAGSGYAATKQAAEQISE